MPNDIATLLNYFQASESLATAGQPTQEQFELIKAAGYEVVLNLALPSSTGALPDEGSLVAGLGMEYIHIPVVWEAPTLGDLARFFKALEQQRDRKVFVHCALNMRVSAFLFLYRVLKLGWTVEAARPDLLRIWEPNETWAKLIAQALAGFYDVICIGNYTKDTIISPAGTRVVDGGAMNYAAHAAAALGLKTAVVTRLASEDRRVIDRLLQIGVDCYPTITPASTCLTLDYPTTNPDIRNLSVASDAGTFTPDQVENLEGRALVIGASFRGEIGLDFLQFIRARKQALVAVDAQGFVRIVVNGALTTAPWDEMQAVLNCIDIFKVDAVEAEALTGESNILSAAQKLAAYGPREIVLTHKDGLLVYADGKDYHNPWRARKLDGRSGRGDTCLGSYTAMRLSTSPKEAATWAAALTSLKMEVSGPFNQPVSAVEKLIREQYQPT